MIIDEPAVLSPSLNSPYYCHESSGYSSKDAECSSPENRTPGVHRHVVNDLRVPMASSVTTTTTTKSIDIHRRRHRIPAVSPSPPSLSVTLPGKRVSHNGSLTIDESSPEPHDIHRTRVRIKRSSHKYHLSESICFVLSSFN